MGMAAEIPADAGSEVTSDNEESHGLVDVDAGESTESSEVFDQAREYVGSQETEDTEVEAKSEEDEEAPVAKKPPAKDKAALAKAAKDKAAKAEGSRYEKRVQALVERAKKSEAYNQQ